MPVLTGEIKMPDSTLGNHPLNADLVDDALSKCQGRWQEPTEKIQ